MHIVNILQCTNLGGTEHGVLRLLEALQPLGHSSEVVSMHPAGQFVPKLTNAGIPVTSLDYRGKFGWRSHLSVRRTLRNVRADHLIMHGPTLSGILALGRVCSGRRILSVHFHHQGVKPDFAWRGLYELVNKRFQFVTFCSDFIRREAESLCPRMAPKCRTVMYPLPVPPLPGASDKADARERLRLPSGVPLIGNAGWLIPRKRFDVFLNVAARVATSVRDVEFVIAGNGTERAALERQSEELGLTGRIHWLGWQTDLSDFYRALDILQFNSEWDAMGLTCLEAASYGVPVVASVIHGGLPEVLGGASACVLREHSIEKLATACADLIQCPDAAMKSGLAGRALVESRCAPRVVAGQYDELLRTTANGR